MDHLAFLKHVNILLVYQSSVKNLFFPIPAKKSAQKKGSPCYPLATLISEFFSSSTGGF
jgi:hypothetical protein